MKKFLLLFLTLTCAAVAQMKIDIGDIDWPNQSASQLFRRNAANNGFEFFTASPQLTLTGDATGTTTFTNLGNGSLALTLANSGVTANTYGSATQVPSFTVDAKGRITGVSLITATPAWGSVTGKPTAVDGSTTQNANTVFAGPASGSAAVPAFRALTQADTQAATAANRNALSPRGGVAFDGSNNARVRSTITGHNVGADPFSLVVLFTLPKTIGANFPTLIALTETTNGATASGLIVWFSSNGVIQVWHQASTGYLDRRSWSFDMSPYLGKSVQLVWVRPASGNPVAYINAADVTSSGAFGAAGTSPSWQSAITSTYFCIGHSSPSDVFSGVVQSATLYNLALSSGDVQDIYELGGAVPERFKFGSQTARLDNSTNNGGFETAGGGGADQFASWTNETRNGTSDVIRDTTDFFAGSASAKFTVGAGAGDQSVYIHGATPTTIGKAFSLELAAKANGGGTVDIQLSGGGNYASFTPATSWGSHSVTFVAGFTGTLLVQCSTKGSTVWVDSIRLRQVGAVVHLPFSDQLGPQARDASTNALHAERTSSGTAWTDPRSSGRQTLTYTFAHSAISSTAATTTAFVLPPNTVLREVQLNRTAAFDGGTTLDIGISGTPTKFVTATSVAGTGFTQVASSSLVPESASATTTVFVKKNQATTTGSVTLNFIIEAVGSPTQ